MTEPKPRYPDNDTAELIISTGEERLLQTIRRGIRGAGRRPYVATIVVTDGLWQVWTGQPAGTVKDSDKEKI
jgi:hypothetical protein